MTLAIHRLEGSQMPAELASQVDAIFFEASGRTSFASPEERAAFRERWLGRYLRGGTDVVLIARAQSEGRAQPRAEEQAQDRAQNPAQDRAQDQDQSWGPVAGYLVGALQDPAEQERFADIDYFRGAFRALCRRYPAHLHINLAPAFRNCGIGAKLIAAFAAHAAAAGAPGLHVVTARAARNVRFYTRCGLAEAGGTCWNGRDVVFLAKSLERCQTLQV